MFYSAYKSSEILKPYIRGYRIIECHDDGHNNSLLPDTSLAMAFVFKGKVNQLINNENLSLPASVITGIRKSPRKVSYDLYTSNMVVLFNPVGVSAFVKHPLHELFNQTIGLQDLFNKATVEQLEEQLSLAESNQERVQMMNDFFRKQLISSQTDRLILEAIKKIEVAQGNIKIAELVKSLYISQDAFEKRFRKTIGATAKHYSTVVRMKTILKNVNNPASLLDKAFDLGYYDQSHFIRDFKLFTGKNPSEYYKI